MAPTAWQVGVKFGIRTPSFKKRIAARTSWKRVVRHNLGIKAPRGWGWLTNPKEAAYNRVYNRSTVSIDRLVKGGGRRRGTRHDGSALLLVLGVIVVAAFGVYLLIAAAVVLIAWLVRVATKPPATQPAIGTAPELQQMVPVEEYASLVPIESSVFDEPEHTRSAASRLLRNPSN